MKEVQVFEKESFVVSTVLDEKQEPWFLVSDVWKVLELENISAAIAGIEDDWLCKVKIDNPTYSPTNKQRKFVSPYFVSEPGLYTLIFRSKKSEAKKFQRWVFEEVLPTLRKTGSYNMTRGFIKIEYKDLASVCFLKEHNKTDAIQTLERVINMVNRAITGMR